MISKSFGYLLTGTCIFNVKNDISVHINRDQFRLNMQYINPMLLRGKQAFIVKLSHLSFLIIIANCAFTESILYHFRRCAREK